MTSQNLVLNKPNSLFEMNTTLDEHLNLLDQNLEALLKYLKEFPDKQLNEKPAPDAWSALQICHHLLIAEKLSLQYIKKKFSFNPKLQPVTMATKMRTRLLKTYLNTPMKFKAPENVSTENLPATSELGDVKNEWLNYRTELRSFLKSLPEDIFNKEVYKHPFAGKLSLQGMLVFFEEHFNRHQKQIKKTLRRVA